MKDPYLVAFGQTIREIRKEQGLSQEGFADIVGIDRSYMGCIERGEKNVTLIKIVQISHALKISPSDIFKRIQL